MKSYRKEIFEQYRTIFSDWLPSGASIAIAMHDQFVYFASGYENISLEIGSTVPKDSMAYRVLHDRTKIDGVMESSVFNTPYYAIGYPIIIDSVPAALVVVLPPMFKQEDSTVTLDFLTGRLDEDWVPVFIEDITYIESLQKKTWFYSKGDQYKTSITLKELEIKLPKNFIRIHRSYIVNLKFIARVTKDFSSNFIIHLKNGVELPVSQSYASSLKKLLNI